MAISFRPLLFLFLAKCLFAISSGTLQAVRFSKTGAVTVSTACRLSTFTPYGYLISVKKACIIKCMKTTDCRFFCIGVAGVYCDLYNSYAAIRFPGHAFGQSYSACYTSWDDPMDVIQTNTTMTYSTQLNPYVYPPPAPTDGYAECGACSYFVTYAYPNSHVQFDLGAVLRVKSVVAQGTISNHFNNIVIYLGNTTSFNGHPVYATRPGSPLAFTTSVIYGNKTILGRYLTIFSPDYVFLGFCEIQVNKF